MSGLHIPSIMWTMGAFVIFFIALSDAKLFDGVDIGPPGQLDLIEGSMPQETTKPFNLSDLTLSPTDPFFTTTTVAPPPKIEKIGSSASVEHPTDYSAVLTAMLVLITFMLAMGFMQLLVLMKVMMAMQRQDGRPDLEEGQSVPDKSLSGTVASECVAAGLQIA
ncbi:hypothetical protein Pmar_PMAR006869 [Perkinsus marinus ATCC 50983]|uniref:Uncharacterized protein n=1 Tax=Perkinsus marinus (strain ATCC 50983 / TXsc) TaxID=423536 RepID=C5K6Q3_PERM5|nr:hypothetical protein Pmar_PMAR006869 [Perkinsus marinus ATCC 50983]EER19973.1 hypothetical protein Pmar_PMAR006869 [Perkinsus marinus ATCC 50983]|eukprot:XP_002788177.1 hypothetical protein Pmar_PMAR006869 [Perkinsus marinus ATCC 50983]